jgi:hypothetical protein
VATRLGRHQAPSSAWIKPPRRLAIYIRDLLKCLYCDRDLRGQPAAQWTLDHLLGKAEYAALPISAQMLIGGINVSRNLVTSCRSCNSSRRHRPFVDFANEIALSRIMATIVLPVDVKLAHAILKGEVPDPRFNLTVMSDCGTICITHGGNGCQEDL